MAMAELCTRARRYDVRWPLKVRRLDDSTWETARSVNISTSGILFEAPLSYSVGERVELEINFLGNNGGTIVGTFGLVVRHHDLVAQASGTAVKFDVSTLAVPFSRYDDS